MRNRAAWERRCIGEAGPAIAIAKALVEELPLLHPQKVAPVPTSVNCGLRAPSYLALPLPRDPYAPSRCAAYLLKAKLGGLKAKRNGGKEGTFKRGGNIS